MGLSLGFSCYYFFFKYQDSFHRHIPLEGFGGPEKDQIVVSPIKDCDFRTSLLGCAVPTECLWS